MKENLFFTVMEAEGEPLQPFDDGAATNEPEAPPEQEQQPAEDMPPELNDDGGDMSFSPDENDTGDEPSPEDDNADIDADKKNNEKLSEKANSILNQKLYQNFVNRNNEVSEIIENVQTVTPLLEYEVTKKVDANLAKLKSALSEGKKYIIDKFIDNKYGENLLFFQKLDTLYTLLLDSINNCLKKINN